MKRLITLASLLALSGIATSCVPLAAGAVGGYILKDQINKHQEAKQAQPAAPTYEQPYPDQTYPPAQEYPTYEDNPVPAYQNY